MSVFSSQSPFQSNFWEYARRSLVVCCVQVRATEVSNFPFTTCFMGGRNIWQILISHVNSLEHKIWWCRFPKWFWPPPLKIILPQQWFLNRKCPWQTESFARLFASGCGPVSTCSSSENPHEEGWSLSPRSLAELLRGMFECSVVQLRFYTRLYRELTLSQCLSDSAWPHPWFMVTPPSWRLHLPCMSLVILNHLGLATNVMLLLLSYVVNDSNETHRCLSSTIIKGFMILAPTWPRFDALESS